MADEIANGSGHSAAYVEETTIGTTPTSPVFKPIRLTGTTLGVAPTTILSAEIRSDRQIVDMRQGNKTVSGDISAELSINSFDDFIEAVMGHKRANIRAITIDADATDDSYNDSGTNLPIFDVGETVSISGFTNSANNGLHTVVTSTTAKLVTSEDVLVTEAEGDTIYIVSQELKTASVRRAFTIERQFTDIAVPEYHRYVGMEVNSMSLDIAPDAIATVSFNFMGRTYSNGTAILSGATYEARTTTIPMDSFSGTINEGSSPIAVVTALNTTIDNAVKPLFVIGSQDSITPSIGRNNVTGSIGAFYESKTLLDKFLGETDSETVFTLTDGISTYQFDIPKINYTGGQPDVSGEEEISLTMPFQALYNVGDLSNMVVTRTIA